MFVFALLPPFAGIPEKVSTHITVDVDQIFGAFIEIRKCLIRRHQDGLQLKGQRL